MPDMPALFYIPLIGALVGAMGVLSTVITVLWRRYNKMVDRVAELEGKQHASK